MGILMAARQPTLARAVAPTGALRLALLIPFLAACASAPVARPGPRSLSQVADSAVAAPPLDRTQWGIEVYDPERGRPLYRLNPMVGVIEAFRWSLLGKGEVDLAAIGVSLAVISVVLVGGLLFFRRMEGSFADVI